MCMRLGVRIECLDRVSELKFWMECWNCSFGWCLKLWMGQVNWHLELRNEFPNGKCGLGLQFEMLDSYYKLTFWIEILSWNVDRDCGTVVNQWSRGFCVLVDWSVLWSFDRTRILTLLTAQRDKPALNARAKSEVIGIIHIQVWISILTLYLGLRF